MKSQPLSTDPQVAASPLPGDAPIEKASAELSLDQLDAVAGGVAQVGLNVVSSVKSPLEIQKGSNFIGCSSDGQSI